MSISVLWVTRRQLFCSAFVFAGLLLVSAFTLLAQSHSGAAEASNILQLRTQPVSLADQRGAFNRLYKVAATSQQYGDRLVVLVQFAQLPDGPTRSYLQEQGLRFYRYYQQNTWLVGAPRAWSWRDYKRAGVQAVGALQARHKLSPELQETPPAHARESQDRVRVVADVLAGVDKDLLNQAAAKHKAEVLEIWPAYNQVLLALPQPELTLFAARPWVLFLEWDEAPPQTELLKARTLVNTHWMNPGLVGLPAYTGDGVVVGMGDDGLIGPHVDYEGRFNQSRLTVDRGNHGDHVAGIIMGAGNLNPRNTGMAPGAFLEVYRGHDPSDSSVLHASSLGLRLASMSLGTRCNRGYNSFAERADRAVLDSDVLQVFSAGNEGRNSSCGFLQGWYNITGGRKTGKNLITVGNLRKDATPAGSSSRGPAEDGRIKPDVTAVGTRVVSTLDPHRYGQKTGTSMACPGVSGALSTLIEAWEDTHGGPNTPLRSDLLKAALLGGAVDLGRPGPDFEFGFGMMDVRASWDILRTTSYWVDSVDQGQVDTFVLQVPANQSLMKVLLYWHDQPAVPAANNVLVNDLDLEVLDNQTTLLRPLVPDHRPVVANLTQPAANRRDTLNNAELVQLRNPGAGQYQILVNGAAVPQGPQAYSLVYLLQPDSLFFLHPVAGQQFTPGDDITVRWTRTPGQGPPQPQRLEYSLDSGQTWLTLQANLPSQATTYDWRIPDTLATHAQLRLVQGGDTTTSSFFLIAPELANLRVEQQCPNFLKVKWDTLDSVASYQIYTLGARYMDSLVRVAADSFVLQNLNPNDTQWIAVAPVFASGQVGQRTNALMVPPGLINCTLDNDLALLEVLRPLAGLYPDCVYPNDTSVQVKVLNNGRLVQDTVRVSYSLNGGPLNTLTSPTPLQPGDSVVLTFPNNLASAPSRNDLRIWTSLPSDENRFNDTVQVSWNRLPSTLERAPYRQDFENFNLNCITDSECGLFPCPLKDGWVNLENRKDDQIDWQTHIRTTPSSNTGPRQDYRPGNNNGRYLYTEASDCDSASALLNTPCFELHTARPYLRFAYHMQGADMGELHLDLFDGQQWYRDITPAILGDQGPGWKVRGVDLSAHAGKTVMLSFRGKTGSGEESDLALDDVLLTDLDSLPIPDFSESVTLLCPGADSVSLFANIQNPYSQLEWSLAPDSGISILQNYNFFNDTLRMRFRYGGLYTVALRASSPWGDSTLVRTQHLEVRQEQPLPIEEDWEAGTAPPAGWSIANPDTQNTWALHPTVVNGPLGSPTRALVMDNHNYPNLNEEDALLLPITQFDSTESAILYYHWAYAQALGGFSDTLKVQISDNCGRSWQDLRVWSGGALATAPITSTPFEPNSSAQWEIDTIDLNQYSNRPVLIRFLNINQDGNHLFLDNINLESGILRPNFNLTEPICAQQPTIFTDSSQGPISIYAWQFGFEAQPIAANGVGPHSVVYQTRGKRTATLTVSGPAQSSFLQKTFYVDSIPPATFSTQTNGLQVQLSTPTDNADSLIWDLGDGTVLYGPSAVHNYQRPDTYIIQLRAVNACGQAIARDTVIFEGAVSRPEPQGGAWSLYPNPAEDYVHVGLPTGSQQGRFQLLDAQGRQVYNTPLKANHQRVELPELPAGVYQLMLECQAGRWNTSLVVGAQQ